MQIVAPALMQLAQQLHDRFAALRIEIARRLVGEQNDRLARDRARHGDALLLSARELARQMFRPMRHAHAFERLGDALAALGRPHAAIGERQLDVLEHGEIADQIEALEDEPDLAIADARALRSAAARRRAGRSARTSPCVGESSSPRIESSVDLPQPDGPPIETYSPRAISTLTFDSACVSTSSVENTFVRSCSLMTGGASIRVHTVPLLLKTNAIEGVPRRHVRQHDLIADVQP